VNTPITGTPVELSKEGTAYELIGPPGKPVVVLIHGIGLSSSLWQVHTEVLAQRYSVLRYDLPGHGASSPVSAKLSLPVLALQLHQLINELEIEQAVVVGFSLGGMINRRFALDFPQRVRALAILNSPHERTPEQQQAVESRLVQTASQGARATVEASLQRWFTPGYLATQSQIVAPIRDSVLATDPHSFAQVREILATGVVELVRPTPPIEVPALVVTCENDSGSTPKMARGIAAEMVDAKIVIVPHLKHLGLIEDPQIFTQTLIGFIDEVVA